MIIKTDEFVTEVSDIASLSELKDAELGTPCMLIVQGSDSLSADRSDKALDGFFLNAPYITALAADGTMDTIGQKYPEIYENLSLINQE